MSNPVEELARKAALFGERYGRHGKLGDVRFNLSEAEAQEILTRFNEVWATLPYMPVLAMPETRKVIPGYVWRTNASPYNTVHQEDPERMPCCCARCTAEHFPTWLMVDEAVDAQGRVMPGIVAFYQPEAEVAELRKHVPEGLVEAVPFIPELVA